MLQDIAILTGGTVISEDLGKKLENIEVTDCGHADKVKSDKENTSIIGGKGDKTAIQARISQIKRELDENTSEFDKEKLQERLAKLSGGVAVINVGAATEVELKDKKERAIDAVAATKAALEEGIVPGGGIALMDVGQKMAGYKSKLVGDELIGFNIVMRSLESPFTKLIENAGLDAGQLLAKAREMSVDGMGFDVLTLESEETAKPVNMIKVGIIDPLKVVRTAVQNAISVGTMVLTTEALITDIPEKKEAAPSGGMPQMPGY